MKFSNLSFFNSRGEELKTNIFFDISWVIDEPFLDDNEKSCRIYPKGYLDGDSNFIVSDQGVILSDKLSSLYSNGYIILNPRLNDDNWQSNLSEAFSDIQYIDDIQKRKEIINQNPLVVKISDLFKGIVGLYNFASCMKKFTFSTSEVSDESLDINKKSPEYYILDKLENTDSKVDVKEVLSDFWTFVRTWYNNGEEEDTRYPYWHFESTVVLEPVSVGLVSPMSLYILDEKELNVFQTPYVPEEYDEDRDEIVTSLYFATDNETLAIFENQYNYSEIEWHKTITKNLNVFTDDEYVEPVTVNVGFSADEEGLYLDELRVYIKKQNLAKDYTSYYYIGTIYFKEKAIGQDERYRTLFTNFGIPDPINYQHVFKEYDPLEEGNDYELVNRKSKELFLSYDKIFPYVGTYKALINAVKFLGYDDIYFKEWYKVLNEEDNHNIEDFNYVSIDMRTGETLQNKLKRFGFTYEQYLNMKKLNRLTMVYHFNMEDIHDDDSVKFEKVTYSLLDGEIKNKGSYRRLLDFPKVIKNFDYSQREMLAKLFYLKKWLEKYIIGVNCRIIDITGEGIYFENLKNNAYAVSYITNDMQKEYSLTPYNVYQETSTGIPQSGTMNGGVANITASLKEYDYTKISDIDNLKFSDFVKYYINFNPSSGNTSIHFITWTPEESADYDKALVDSSWIGSKYHSASGIDWIQLFGAPFAAPFILDEYLYELKTIVPTGSLIELNDGWSSGSLDSTSTLFVDKNEIYISDPESNKVTWSENAPYIKLEEANFRDITVDRWGTSLKYSVKKVFDTALNKYVYKLWTYPATNKRELNIISDDYIILAPVAGDNDLRLCRNYRDASANMTSLATETDWNKLKKKYSGIFIYSENNFYESPMIQPVNYKIMYTEGGIVKTVKDERGDLVLLGDSSYGIGNIVLEIIEGRVDSREIGVMENLIDNEDLLASLYFTNNEVSNEIWNLLNGYTTLTMPDLPIDDQNSNNILLNGEQYIYPEYMYKTHRQKFYEIQIGLYEQLKEIISRSSDAQNYIDYEKPRTNEKEELEEKWNNIINSDIPEEDSSLYWDETDTSIFNKLISEKLELKKNIEKKQSKDYYNNSNLQKYSYNDRFLNKVQINKETDIFVNHIGKYILTVKGYDAYNNIFMNTCEDYILVGGEKPDLNAYTIYDSIDDYEEYNLYRYSGIKLNENNTQNLKTNLRTLMKQGAKFPKSYRLYGIDCTGDETISYDNVSYIYDTFKVNDYVIFNNFTNRIYGELPNMDNNGGTIKLWRQNYNLDSVNRETSTYFGIVLYNEQKMQLYYDKPIIVQGICTNIDSDSQFYEYDIKYIYEKNEDERNIVKNLIRDYNKYDYIKAFLINVQQYDVANTNNLENISVNQDTGNSVIKISIDKNTVPMFSKGQVIKLVYTKSNDNLQEWKYLPENEYIASTSYRIQDIKISDTTGTNENGVEYFIDIELNGRINTDLLENHYYNNYFIKTSKHKDSDNLYYIEKEVIENINLTVCYANISPVSYTERLKYDGWENALTGASFVIDKNYLFLNDYIDSGYSAYRMEFDPVNALYAWEDSSVINDIINGSIDLYKYPQDQGTVISKGDFIILESDDRNGVLDNTNIYYEWSIYNNFIKNTNNLLYKFTNAQLILNPEFFEKYNVNVKMRDIYGNVIENKSNAKFFVK